MGDRWAGGDDYERCVGRWSRQVAARATLPIEPDGSIALVARAWAVRGRVRERPQ
jgi:hypothetical protein